MSVLLPTSVDRFALTAGSPNQRDGYSDDKLPSEASPTITTYDTAISRIKAMPDNVLAPAKSATLRSFLHVTKKYSSRKPHPLLVQVACGEFSDDALLCLADIIDRKVSGALGRGVNSTTEVLPPQNPNNVLSPSHHTNEPSTAREEGNLTRRSVGSHVSAAIDGTFSNFVMHPTMNTNPYIWPDGPSHRSVDTRMSDAQYAELEENVSSMVAQIEYETDPSDDQWKEDVPYDQFGRPWSQLSVWDIVSTVTVEWALEHGPGPMS